MAEVVLEREYTVGLRRAWLVVPRYKRAKKAVKALKEFIARHMKVENRDVTKVKIDKWLNNEIWFRGARKPPAKIKVKARKYADGTVYVELAEMPEKIKYAREREKRRHEAKAKAAKEEKAEEKEKTKEEIEKDKKEAREVEEKEKAVEELEEKIAKQEAKGGKQIEKAEKAAQKGKQPVRKALSRH